MKTLKLFAGFLVLMGLVIITITSCKKDDDKSAPGYFTIDGAKHELSKCYISKRINNDAGHEDEDNYDLVFASESITLTDISGMPEGSGNMFAVVFTTEINQEGIESGEYNFGFDESIPFSYFGTSYFVGYNSSNQTIEEDGEPDNNTSIKVTKTGDTYQFLLEGETEDGKTFVFSFNGKILTLASHEV